MNELTKTLTSLEVAEMVGKEHNELLKDLRRYSEQFSQGKIPQSDFFTESTYKTERGKIYPCYFVTKKGCEFIANKLTGAKGTEFTAKYINRFHEMETELRSVDKLFDNPDTIIRLATEWKKEKLLRQQAEAKNAILTHVTKTYTMTEIAKELNLRSAMELNRMLCDKHIQYKVNNTWVMCAKYSNCGYEEIKQDVLDNGTVLYHRKITQLGREFILGLFDRRVAE